MIKDKYHKSGVYSITCNINGGMYIGSTTTLFNRYRSHLHYLRKKKHGNRNLQDACNKYGLDSLVFEIIEFCGKDKLIEREQYYIDNTNNIFNLSPCAESNLGLKIPKGRRTYGRKMSQKTKEILIKANTGNKYNLGRYPSEEIKRKISKALKGRVISKETLIKRSNSLKGRIVSEKTRALMSEIMKGNTNFQNTDRNSKEFKELHIKGCTKYNFEQYDLDMNLIKVHLNGHTAAKYIGVHQSSIYQACEKKNPIFKGFIWKRVKVKK